RRVGACATPSKTIARLLAPSSSEERGVRQAWLAGRSMTARPEDPCGSGNRHACGRYGSRKYRDPRRGAPQSGEPVGAPKRTRGVEETTGAACVLTPFPFPLAQDW